MSGATDAAPRWGNVGRERKADAILGTLRAYRGPGVATGRWVDIGCGSGGIAAALAGQVDTVVGVDPEPWPQWRELAAGAGNLSFVAAACDGDDLPVPAGSADVVVCNQVYEHVRDPRQLLANIRQILKPGGCCYFAGPNLLWPIEPHVYWPFVHWLPRRAAQGTMRLLGSHAAGDLDAYSTHSWRLRRWIAAAGLQVEEGVRERLAQAFEGGAVHPLAKIVRAMPRGFFSAMMPILPGFVFVLTRPPAGDGAAAGSGSGGTA